jgi:hypothetical protein
MHMPTGATFTCANATSDMTLGDESLKNRMTASSAPVTCHNISRRRAEAPCYLAPTHAHDDTVPSFVGAGSRNFLVNK